MGEVLAEVAPAEAGNGIIMAMQSYPLSEEAILLEKALKETKTHKQAKTGELVHVDGVGATLYFAYEQIRNAAEYSEQHLLMRRAIERFLQRSINFSRLHPLGKELIIDLTQARYLKNDSVSKQTVKIIDDQVQQFAELYKHSIKIRRNKELVRKWVLQTASVHIEQLLGHTSNTNAFSAFAYAHYYESIDRDRLEPEVSDQKYQIALYCAVHREILKSDEATTRAYALSSQILVNGPENPAAYFVELNRMFDELYADRLTNRLVRLIGQYGAPMRIIRELVFKDEAEQLLGNSRHLFGDARGTTYQQYKLVRERLNKGIVRSVAFVFITKILIGLIIEIPYDLIRYGAIVWGPLLINLLFPPLYMATLGLSIRQPSAKNVDLIEDAIDRILYKTDRPRMVYRLRRRVDSSTLNGVFNVLYGITFIAWMSILAWILYKLNFNIVSGIIFFIFLSTVSFLGFRLTRTAREYEMIEARRGTLGFLADFFYTPFIRIGHWLSDTYSRLNVVTRVLDILIEMPMKFVLRFMQQWVSFLRDKQEEI